MTKELKFERKKKEGQEEPPLGQTLRAAEEILRGIRTGSPKKVLGGLVLAGKEVDPAVQILLYLSSLDGKISSRLVAEWTRRHMRSTLQELELMARGSDELKWKSSPAYYKALALAIEAKRRESQDDDASGRNLLTLV